MDTATFTASAGPALPSPWNTADVGAVGRDGSASYAAGTFTVSGAGADVWGTADAFRFVYRTLNGDGRIVARLATLAGSQDWVKAGVMMRGSLAADSAHAFMLVSRTKGLAFQRRTDTGGVSLHTAAGTGTAPRWVRLERAGNVITASVSGDGSAWTTVGSSTVRMGENVLVGMAVSSHTTSSTATATFDSVAVVPSATLPAGWIASDVGAVGVAGSAAENAGVFTVSGAGADVWGTADAFHFASRPLAGDGQIVARVGAIAGSDPWTKVGVMIRESTAAGAAHAFMLVSSGKGLAFQRRTTAGGLSTHSGVAGSVPRWVKLVRSGNTITGSVSTDAVTWTTVGSDTFTMGASALIGLAVSSHTASATATGTFDGVTISGSAPALPVGWSTSDIGAVGRTGSAGANGNVFTVTGAGADVWGTADAFRFAYVPMSGDGEIVARVAGIAGTQAWTKVGVMIRESLSANAAHGFMLLSGGKGAAFQRRPAAGGESVHTAGPLVQAPGWVRLRRSGATITASFSLDGAAWTTIGTQTFAMGANVYAGLAVSSHDVAALATGRFEQVAVAD